MSTIKHHIQHSKKIKKKSVKKKDNDRLMELQESYLSGRGAALSEIYILSTKVCKKIIQKQQAEKQFNLSPESLEEKSHNAASYLITQYLKRPDFKIESSVTSYLYLRCLHELYYHRRIDKIIEYNSDLLQKKY